MSQRLGLLASFFVVACVIVGCTDANDQFIQGSWYYRDPHLDSVSGETYLEITWTFGNGTFEYFACCFNVRSHLAGRYRIVESKDDRLVLELFNIRGNGGADRIEIGIKINSEEDTLTIQASGPFTRTLTPLRSKGTSPKRYRQ